MNNFLESEAALLFILASKVCRRFSDAAVVTLEGFWSSLEGSVPCKSHSPPRLLIQNGNICCLESVFFWHMSGHDLGYSGSHKNIWLGPRTHFCSKSCFHASISYKYFLTCFQIDVCQCKPILSLYKAKKQTYSLWAGFSLLATARVMR